MAEPQGRRESISVFFPAYNDWGTIASMVVLAFRVLEQVTDDGEVIVVNDASPDHTGDILSELMTRYPKLRCITHARNLGYGGALRSGFAAARGDWIFYTDGDAQYDVRELSALWERRAGVDLVNGYKIRRSDPWYRAVIGRMYHHLVRALFDLPVRDVDCDFRLMRRSIFERFALTENSGLICVELMAKVRLSGCTVAQVPVHHFHRMHGKSQFFNLSRVGRVLWRMTGLWWRLRVRHEPLGSSLPMRDEGNAGESSQS